MQEKKCLNDAFRIVQESDSIQYLISVSHPIFLVSATPQTPEKWDIFIPVAVKTYSRSEELSFHAKENKSVWKMRVYISLTKVRAPKEIDNWVVIAQFY